MMLVGDSSVVVGVGGSSVIGFVIGFVSWSSFREAEL
jgi:hypothetical protein